MPTRVFTYRIRRRASRPGGGQAQGAILSEMPRKQEVVCAVTLAQQGFALVDRLYPYRFRTFCIALDVNLDVYSAAL